MFPARLQHPNKAANPLEADHQQKITMRFGLRDRAAGQLMAVHQAFVRFSPASPAEGATAPVFVAEQDPTTNTYKFDMVSVCVRCNVCVCGWVGGCKVLSVTFGEGQACAWICLIKLDVAPTQF